MQSRRDFLAKSVSAGALLLARPLAAREREYSRRAVDLVRESLVIDMLGLLTLDWKKLERWQRQPGGFGAADVAKLKQSGIKVFHPAVDLNSSDPFTAARECLRDWNTFLGNYPWDLARVERAPDFEHLRHGRRIGVLLGFQNSDHFRKVSDVGYFHGLGQRISQLTYNSPNLVGSGCTSPRDTGLTEFGTAVVAEMNRCGMAVDISHSGDCTSLEAIEASTKPVLITHSNCRALVPRHPRCKPDDVIRRLAARGGVMGITSIRGFVRNQEPTTIEDVLDHFDYVARLVGVEHIGVGSDNDLDGRDHSLRHSRMDVDGLNHPQRIFDLTEGLIRRGYSNRSIRLVLGENFRRALAEIWKA